MTNLFDWASSQGTTSSGEAGGLVFMYALIVAFYLPFLWIGALLFGVTLWLRLAWWWRLVPVAGALALHLWVNLAGTAFTWADVLGDLAPAWPATAIAYGLQLGLAWLIVTLLRRFVFPLKQQPSDGAN